MTLTKAVSVIGYKDSGKTRVVEALVKELTDRGYRVGTLKHTAEDVLLDTPGKDTWRHREAGSRATAILHGKGSAFFIDRYFTVNEAASRLGSLDFVVLEGFKSLKTMAKIIVPRNAGEIEGLSNGLEIAMADLVEERLPTQGSVPVVPLEEVGELADVVAAKAFPMLSGLDCHGCGYEDCLGLGRAILAGGASFEDCVGYASGFKLKVNGEVVSLGPFVQDITKNVVLGLVRSFKGVEAPSEVELEFETGGNDG
jgi:molybdopterin-guanine dinucleotide biosynthesis protein B